MTTLLIPDKYYDRRSANAYADGLRAGVEAAAVVSDGWANSKSCDSHDDNPCCHVRTGAGIATTIRTLTPEIKEDFDV